MLEFSFCTPPYQPVVSLLVAKYGENFQGALFFPILNRSKINHWTFTAALTLSSFSTIAETTNAVSNAAIRVVLRFHLVWYEVLICTWKLAPPILKDALTRRTGVFCFCFVFFDREHLNMLLKLDHHVESRATLSWGCEMGGDNNYTLPAPLSTASFKVYPRWWPRSLRCLQSLPSQDYWSHLCDNYP